MWPLSSKGGGGKAVVAGPLKDTLDLFCRDVTLDNLVVAFLKNIDTWKSIR